VKVLLHKRGGTKNPWLGRSYLVRVTLFCGFPWAMSVLLRCNCASPITVAVQGSRSSPR
jgi:hypothetical protein